MKEKKYPITEKNKKDLDDFLASLKAKGSPDDDTIRTYENSIRRVLFEIGKPKFNNSDLDRVFAGINNAGTKELLKIDRINFDETLLLHVGAAVNLGKVISLKGNVAKLKLTRPICAPPSSRVAISRKIAARWRLIGYGILLEKTK